MPHTARRRRHAWRFNRPAMPRLPSLYRLFLWCRAVLMAPRCCSRGVLASPHYGLFPFLRCFCLTTLCRRLSFGDVSKRLRRRYYEHCGCERGLPAWTVTVAPSSRVIRPVRRGAGSGLYGPRKPLRTTEPLARHLHSSSWLSTDAPERPHRHRLAYARGYCGRR